MGIYVVSKREFGEGGIYVGRGRGSVLGNPFVMKSEADREKVIAQYRIWLWQKVKERGKVFAELVRIKKLAEQGDVHLACWCRAKSNPRSCHGDVIKSCLEWMIKENIG